MGRKKQEKNRSLNEWGLFPPVENVGDFFKKKKGFKKYQQEIIKKNRSVKE